jgi:hypothetical protein
MADNSLGILIAIGMIIIGFFWFITLLLGAWKTRRLRKHYNAYEDTSLQGEQRRRLGEGEFGRRTKEITEKSRSVAERDFTPSGLSESQRRGFLPTTASNPARESYYGTRQDSPSPRGIFKALRRK